MWTPERARKLLEEKGVIQDEKLAKEVGKKLKRVVQLKEQYQILAGKGGSDFQKIRDYVKEVEAIQNVDFQEEIRVLQGKASVLK